MGGVLLLAGGGGGCCCSVAVLVRVVAPVFCHVLASVIVMSLSVMVIVVSIGRRAC